MPKLPVGVVVEGVVVGGELTGGLLGTVATAVVHAGVMPGAGLAVDTQVLPFQPHHRQDLFSW
jgi:hypothetical protein